MSFSFERRKHFRHEDFEARRIEWSFCPFDAESFEGFISNVSESGMCLLVSRPLSEGQEITIRDDVNGSRTVLVRWIEKVDEGYYKAGVIF